MISAFGVEHGDVSKAAPGKLARLLTGARKPAAAVSHENPFAPTTSEIRTASRARHAAPVHQYSPGLKPLTASERRGAEQVRFDQKKNAILGRHGAGR